MELITGCLTGALTIASIFAFMFWLEWRMAPPFARGQVEAALRYLFTTIDRVNKENWDYLVSGEFMDDLRNLFNEDDDDDQEDEK